VNAALDKLDDLRCTQNTNVVQQPSSVVLWMVNDGIDSNRLSVICTVLSAQNGNDILCEGILVLCAMRSR